MRENIRNTDLKIDEVLEELYFLRDRNEFLERSVRALKHNNAAITIERNQLVEKLNKQGILLGGA